MDTVPPLKNGDLITDCPSEKELLITIPFVNGIKIDETLKKNYLCIAQALRQRNLDLSLSKNNLTALGLGLFALGLLIVLMFLIYIYFKHKNRYN